MALSPKEYYHRAYDHTPTGKLALSIETWAGDHRRTWRDGHKQRLEDCLNAFIVALVASAEACRLRTLRWERERMEREERERQWQEEQRRRAEEENRTQALIKEVSSWHLAGQIRGYIQLVKDEAARTGIEVDPAGELASWMAWVSKKASEMNPLPRRLHSHSPSPARSDGGIPTDSPLGHP